MRTVKDHEIRLAYKTLYKAIEEQAEETIKAMQDSNLPKQVILIAQMESKLVNELKSIVTFLGQSTQIRSLYERVSH